MLKLFFENPDLQSFFLVFIRISGLVVFVPPFLSDKLTLQLKGGLVFFLAIAIFPTVRHGDIIIPYNFPELGLAVAFELLIGMTIGLSVQILFLAFQLSGSLIDINIGFAMASLVDPTTDIDVTIIGSLFMNLALYMFLCFGGHMWVIKTFAGSFSSMPLLEMNIHIQGLVYHIAKMFNHAFCFALSIALPVIIVVLLVHTVNGFLSKTIPQLQIFTVGFIITITLGLISLHIIFLQFVPMAENIIDSFEQEIWFLITNLKNG